MVGCEQRIDLGRERRSVEPQAAKRHASTFSIASTQSSSAIGS
jgi:hypothetical protein